MKIIITGGCGFLGSNIALKLISLGEDVFLFDNLSRVGSDKNLERIRKLNSRIEFTQGDIRNFYEIEPFVKRIKPDAIYHLAGQVAMTTSIQNPRLDFEINTLGTLNVLEAVRINSPNSIVVYSSTNKVYGDLEYLDYKETDTRYIAVDYPNGFDENLKLDFHSPYGCSKGAADQYMLDYHRIFGLNTIVLRHSSMYGINQYATYDQGWVGWFIQEALRTKGLPNTEICISGNGKQVRDLLFSDDVVNCYLMIIPYSNQLAGQAFNIGGGHSNSLSIIELLTPLGKYLGTDFKYKLLKGRESDQKVFISDNNKIRNNLGWTPTLNAQEGIKIYFDWINQFVG